MLRLIPPNAAGDTVSLRRRIVGMYALLMLANLVVWGWALLAFRLHPVLLGTALLADGFGLRHAADADHIAAIDNVTRKLMQEGKRPVGIGFFFAIGHSLVWCWWRRRSPRRLRRSQDG